ncbi:UNVERIFIED_CONTAM: hypothetical protein RMT77_017011 [Armadillidium vulgare]
MEFIKILFHFNLFSKLEVEKSINEFLTSIFRPSLHFPTVPKKISKTFVSLTSQLNRNILTILETTFPQCLFVLIKYN